MKLNIILLLMVFLAACSKDENKDGNKGGTWTKVGEVTDGGKPVALTNGVCFKIGERVYLGLGADRYTETPRKFYTTTDGIKWDTIKSFPGVGRIAARVSVEGNRACVGGGKNIAYDCEDYYCYDSDSGEWTDSIPSDWEGEFFSTERYFNIYIDKKRLSVDNAASFSLIVNKQKKTYVVTGKMDGFLSKRCWESYTSGSSWISTDVWKEIEPQPKEMSPRVYAFAFTINGCGYVYGGTATSIANEAHFPDVWKFEP